MSKLSIIIYAMTIGLLSPLSFVSAGTILSSHNYAWSNNSGYINFESVTVSDSALGGYAWSANDGWINFAPALGGVLNDGNGNLSGYAWGERLGWIDFDDVEIGADGRFSGFATGTLIGTLSFDCSGYCDVTTDWASSVVTVDEDVTNGPGSGQVADSDTTSPEVESELSIEPTTAIQDQLSEEANQIDILKDGVLNIVDFNALMVNWGKNGFGNVADMNEDSSVDIIDFNILMIYWGVSYQL